MLKPVLICAIVLFTHKCLRNCTLYSVEQDLLIIFFFNWALKYINEVKLALNDQR